MFAWLVSFSFTVGGSMCHSESGADLFNALLIFVWKLFLI